MKRIRILMLKTEDQLFAGNYYNVPTLTALDLARRGFAELPAELRPQGPSEIKPVEPTEIKAKKKLRHKA
jgi:hypothetical protein